MVDSVTSVGWFADYSSRDEPCPYVYSAGALRIANRPGISPPLPLAAVARLCTHELCELLKVTGECSGEAMKIRPLDQLAPYDVPIGQNSLRYPHRYALR